MKKLLLSFSAVLLLASPMTAQRLVEDNFNQLKVQYTTPHVDFKAADYINLNVEGYVLGGEVGKPALPMLNTMLTVPFCERMEVVVENAVYETIDLPAGMVMPLQPSQSKSYRGKIEFQMDDALYGTDAFYGRPLASIEPVGVGRDRNYALLTFSPVTVNPVSGKMTVCRSADVTVRYVGVDVERTMEVYDRYHTPAFSLGTTFNKLFNTPKAVRTEAPVRMVIVAGRSLQCHAIEEFANWKRTQGMMVDIIYTEAGASANSIAAQIKALYTDATEEAPAPTYLLLMGDVAQLKAHSSRLSSSWYGPDNDHVTDLYYVSWTDNDYVPDCYLGRFSATDTNTLRGIIDKTIYYERYDFANDDYLTSGILVAGVDRGESGDNAYNYGDPAMDYAAYFYVNDSNGFSDVRYYKNNTNYAPDGVNVTGSSQASSTATILRARYNEGAGWINYTAHGDWNCWGDPEFTVNHANQMSNNDKPSFMLGNCCLTNKFEKTTCLGEALLRKGNRAGAIGYIGGTNSTYWTEDFYWSVGVRNNIFNTMAPQYNANNLGMYDRLFHTHNESASAQAVSASHMMMMGNMAVQGSTSSASMKQYYWEIYELMGDPSLMPWLGKAKTMSNVWATRANDTEVVVYVTPGSYVALVSDNGDSLALQSATFAGADGAVRLTATANLNQCFISVIAQNYKPVKIQCSTLGLNAAEGAAATISPNPASGRCEVSAEGLRKVTVLNLMGQTMGSQPAVDGRCTLSLDRFQPGLYLLRLTTAGGTSVKKLVVK